MLSVLIYEPSEAKRDAMCRTLAQVPGAESLKIIFNTDSLGSFSKMLSELHGVALIILGLALRPEDNRKRCLELGSALARRNRDCYTVYDIHDLDDLPALLPHCSKPAGILLGNYTQSQASACFKRIIDDYAAISSDTDSSETMFLESGATSYRLPYNQIVYIEALNKKLNICTVRQSITVRYSMNKFADALPDYFLRCHRSYIINAKLVDVIDYREMLVTMTDGSRLPIARSMKDAFQAFFGPKRGDDG